jgi:hypothetical protein
MAAMSPLANILVNPNFMAPRGDGHGSDMTVCVVADASPTATARALHRAAHRLAYVDQYGVEHHDDDQLDRDLDLDPTIETPNYIGGIWITSSGVACVLDYAVGEERGFVDAAVNIITEELLEAGIQRAEISALPEHVRPSLASAPDLPY